VDGSESLYSYLFVKLELGKLLWAARIPLLLTAAAMPLAIVIGLFLALMRQSRHFWLSWPAAAYIEVMRGTPLFVQLFFVFYSLPRIGYALFGNDLLTLEPFPTAVMCLALNYAAYEAEIHRAGLQAVDKGQREAALSIGMNEQQSFRIVVLPQAFRVVLPPIINDAIAMLKDSCLASAIGVQELLRTAEGIGRAKFNSEEMYIVAAVLYMILSLGFYALGKWVESRLKAQGQAELKLEQVHGH